MKISETSTDYEKLAKKIYEEILSAQGVENIDVRHNVKIKGKSDVEHQIDVFWEYKYAGVTHRVIIECKHYGHPVSLLHVRNLHGLTIDIPNSTGILITTIGFQSGAKDYAEFYDMNLKLIRKPRGEDWDGFIQIVKIQIKAMRNHYLHVELSFDGKHQTTREIIEKSSATIPTEPTEMVIREDGHEPCAFNMWLDRHVLSGSEGFGIETETTLAPDNSYLLTPDRRELKLGNIVVKHMTTQLEKDIEIDAMNFVEAVLQDFNSGDVEHMHHKNL